MKCNWFDYFIDDMNQNPVEFKDFWDYLHKNEIEINDDENVLEFVKEKMAHVSLPASMGSDFVGYVEKRFAAEERETINLILILFCYWNFELIQNENSSFPEDIELEKGPEDLSRIILENAEKLRKRLDKGFEKE